MHVSVSPSRAWKPLSPVRPPGPSPTKTTWWPPAAWYRSTASDAHVSLRVGQTSSNDRSGHSSTTRSSPRCTWCQGCTPANHVLASDGGGSTSYAATSTPRRDQRGPVSRARAQLEHATRRAGDDRVERRVCRHGEPVAPQDLGLEWLVARRSRLCHELRHVVNAPAFRIASCYLGQHRDPGIRQPRAARGLSRGQIM